MEFKLKRKHDWVELTIQGINATITSDYWNGNEIDGLISDLEEIIEELKIQQDK